MNERLYFTRVKTKQYKTDELVALDYLWTGRGWVTNWGPTIF
jgi:hypothetical protein